MARRLEKHMLKERFGRLSDPGLRARAMRRLAATPAPEVNDEGDRLERGLRAVRREHSAADVADAVALSWVTALLAAGPGAASESPVERGLARLFMHGRSQAVRLPKEFRMPGDRVRVRRAGTAVVLEPLSSDIDLWFAEIDRHIDDDFMADGRRQPPMPSDKVPIE